MERKIRSHANARLRVRLERKKRISRKRALETDKRVRLVVYRSNRFLYAQIIDDAKGHTLGQANTQEDAFKTLKSKKNVEAAKQLGILIGQRGKSANVSQVFFDRNGYNYHGRVKAVADGAREAGLDF